MSSSVSALRPLLQPIVDQAARLLDVTDAGLYLRDVETDELELFVAFSTAEPVDSFLGQRLAFGEGMAGHVARTGQSEIIADYQDLDRRPATYADKPWRAAMAVPLYHDGEILGVISVAHRSEGRALDELDLDLLKAFAEQASVTISHAQDLTEERRWSQALRRLNQISHQWLQPRTNLQTLLDEVVDAAAALIDVRYGLLYLFDPRSETLTLAASNHSIVDERTQLDMDEGLTGRVAESGQPVSIHDYENWPHRSTKWTGIGIHSALGVPLSSGGHLLGVLDVAHDGPYRFVDEDVQMLQLLADQAALSIEGAQRAALHRRFQDIGEQLLHATERSGLGDILENVVRSLVEYSPFQVAAISVFDRALPADHDATPTIEDVYIAGLPADQEAKLRRYAKEGAIIPNGRITKRGRRIGDGYYISPDQVPEIEQIGVPIDQAESAETEVRPSWGEYDNFYYFLRLDRRVIGRISLSDPVHGLLPTDEELEPVEGFVSFAAVAVQRARYQERLETLYRISQELGAIDALQALYDEALELLADLFPFDYAAMNRVNTETRQLRIVSQRGLERCPFVVGDTIPFDLGICGWVATHRQAEIVDDVTEDERYIKGDVPMGSELTVPVELGETLLGVLNLESTQTEAFTDEDRHLLEALSDQLAVAISNLERRERLEDFQSRLHGVYSLSERLVHITDLDDLCDQAVDLIHENFPYDYVVLLTLDGDRLVRRGFRSKLPEEELLEENFRRLTLDRGITGWAARHMTAALVNDVAQSEHYIPGHERIRSELAMPIIESGQVLGVLNIESTHVDAFSRDDQELLEALARQLGVAMRSIERRSRVEELNDFLRELNAIEGVNELLDWVLDRVITLLEPKAEGGSVMFYDEASDEFVFRKAHGRPVETLQQITYSPDELHQVISTDRPTFLTASDQIDHPITHRIREELEMPPPASTLSLPIRDRETHRVIAILHVNNFHEEGVFTETDAKVLLDLREEITAALLRARDREQLRELAIRDALTGAYNRHFLNAFLEQERERSERYAHPLSLVMVDIDGFYEVNDRFGHAEGDRILRELAQRLTHNVRIPDRVVRYGGDEFVIVMPETDEAEAQRAMTRIQTIIEDWDPGLDGLSLAFSFGVASWTTDKLKRPEEILNEADAFMYRRRSSAERRRAHKREISRSNGEPTDDPDESTSPSSF